MEVKPKRKEFRTKVMGNVKSNFNPVPPPAEQSPRRKVRKAFGNRFCSQDRLHDLLLAATPVTGIPLKAR